jgi:hypothetical protein
MSSRAAAATVPPGKGRSIVLDPSQVWQGQSKPIRASEQSRDPRAGGLIAFELEPSAASAVIN